MVRYIVDVIRNAPAVYVYDVVCYMVTSSFYESADRQLLLLLLLFLLLLMLLVLL
jgi:hypothetical protein